MNKMAEVSDKKKKRLHVHLYYISQIRSKIVSSLKHTSSPRSNRLLVSTPRPILAIP